MNNENTIQGVKVKLSTSKLAELIKKRIEHHKERCKFYREQIDKFKNNGIITEGFTNSPVQSMENNLKTHDEKLSFLNFFVNNMVTDSDMWYLLSDHDCRTLELI